jgi:phosphoglucomutase
VKTIVTSDLALGICKKYGCEVREVLTGFKYIGEQIGLLEKEGHPERFIFGFEESYGYLSGSYVRDKDGVVAAMLICEMAAYYKKLGLSLLNVLNQLYREHGVFRHSLLTREFSGAEGMRIMKHITNSLRQSPPRTIADLPVISMVDYLSSVRTDLISGKETVIDLPKSDVLSFGLPENSSVVIRPSGTEPKIKLYITATGETPEKADNIKAILEKAALELLIKPN